MSLMLNNAREKKSNLNDKTPQINIKINYKLQENYYSTRHKTLRQYKNAQKKLQ